MLDGLVKQMTQSGAETSHTQPVSHTGEFTKLASFIQGPEEISQCAQEGEGKRTSWILRVTILGLIYTLVLLLTKLITKCMSKYK